MVTPTQNQTGTATGARPTNDGGRAGGDAIKDQASQLANEARSESKVRIDEMRGAAADKIETLADSAQAAATELKDDDIGHLSDYVAELAESMSQLSSNMREKTGDDLLHEVSRLARDNPALFVTGSIAIGFGLSRFAKASTPSERGSGNGTDHKTSSGAEDSDRFASSPSATSSSVTSPSATSSAPAYTTPGPAAGISNTGASNAGVSRPTGSGSTPPYGTQGSTRTPPVANKPAGSAGAQQTGVRS